MPVPAMCLDVDYKLLRDRVFSDKVHKLKWHVSEEEQMLLDAIFQCR